MTLRTTHFTLDELTRSRTAEDLGIDNTPPVQLNAALVQTLCGLERVRAYLGEPIFISSGYRSPLLNKSVGGEETSQHLKGEAVDFRAPGFGTPEEVVKALKPAVKILGVDQLILEPGWVHMSFSTAPRYQVLRSIGGGRYAEYS